MREARRCGVRLRSGRVLVSEPLTRGADADDPEVLRARSVREHKARLASEAIAEKATRELYDRKGDLELLEAVANASNAAKDVRSALKVTVDAVCGRSGWPIGHVWLLSRDGETLVPTGVWHLDDPERFAGFKRITEASTFTSGVGVPGRVLASRVSRSGSRTRRLSPTSRARRPPRARRQCRLCLSDPDRGKRWLASSSSSRRRSAEPDDRLLELAGQVGHPPRAGDRARSPLAGDLAALPRSSRATRPSSSTQTTSSRSSPMLPRTTSPSRCGRSRGFVQLLQQRYEGQLDESADEFIGFIVDGTERMQALIEGLLSYSRTGRSELVTTRVDLNDTLNRAIGALAAVDRRGGSRDRDGRASRGRGRRDTARPAVRKPDLQRGQVPRATGRLRSRSVPSSRAAPGTSSSPTTGSGSTSVTASASSTSSSACTAPGSTRARASGSRSARRSSSATAAASGSRRRRAVAAPSGSSCPGSTRSSYPHDGRRALT